MDDKESNINPEPAAPAETPEAAPVEETIEVEEVVQTEQPLFAKQPADQGAPKKPKKKIGIIITICLAAVLLIGGGVFATFYLAWRNSDPIVVHDAFIATTGTKGILSGSIEMEIDDDSQDTSGIETIRMSFDGAIGDNANYSIGGKITVVTTSDDELTLDVDGAFISDGAMYAKISGIKDALIELELPEEYADILDYLEDIIDGIDGEWYKFTIDDLNLDKDDKKSLTCTQDMLKAELSADAKLTAALYEKYPYYIVNGSTGRDSRSNTVYNVGWDAYNYEKYISGLKETEGFESIASCSPEDLSSNDENSKINLHIDVGARELRGMSTIETSDGSTTKMELFFDYDENAKVEIPENAKSVNDLMTNIESAYKNYITAVIKEQGMTFCEAYAGTAYYDQCLATFDDQTQYYLEDTDFSDLLQLSSSTPSKP